MLDRRQVAALAVLVAVLGWLYHDVLAGLVSDWWTYPDDSHGFLVPLVSLYLVYERRHRLAGLPRRPSWWGAALLGLGILALLAGHVGAELFSQRMSLVVVILGLIGFNLGLPHLKVLAFPTLFLAMAVPLPQIVLNAVALPLQLLAARCAEWVLNLLSIPVFREGNIINLAHISLEVAEACSGIRSLVSLITLAMVVAYFFQRRWPARVLLTVSAVPIAVVTNTARVAGTGILAQYYGERVVEGFYHSFSGWLMFVVAFAILVVESALIRAFLAWRARRREA